MGPIILGKCVIFCAPSLNGSREIPPEAAGDGDERRLYRSRESLLYLKFLLTIPIIRLDVVAGFLHWRLDFKSDVTQTPRYISSLVD